MCASFAKHSQYTFDHLCIDYLAVFSPALYLECEQHTSLKPTHSGHTEAMCALVAYRLIYPWWQLVCNYIMGLH